MGKERQVGARWGGVGLDWAGLRDAYPASTALEARFIVRFWLQCQTAFCHSISRFPLQEADVAAGALSVRPWRRQFVEFSVPFMESGIATVLKRPGPPGAPGDASPPLPIESPRDLLNASGLRYGCIPGSLTQAFFRTSPDRDYRKMWHVMSTTLPSVFEWTSRKGIARVRESNGNYVFMLESVFASYLVGEPPCDLVMLDILLNPSEYAFAMQKGSGLVKKINRALTQLKEAGVVDKLYRRWWKSKCERRYNRKHSLKDESFKDDSTSGRKKGRRKDKKNEPEVEEVEPEVTPPPRKHHRKLKTRTISLSGAPPGGVRTRMRGLLYLISISVTYLTSRLRLS